VDDPDVWFPVLAEVVVAVDVNGTEAGREDVITGLIQSRFAGQARHSPQQQTRQALALVARRDLPASRERDA